mmetsp:Transcript_675/g.1372  ORF Transcript_675/g.1372 Transcript_675/m.1372 type:complete len:145 (+) Transcript_675:79-513(+)
MARTGRLVLLVAALSLVARIRLPSNVAFTAARITAAQRSFSRSGCHQGPLHIATNMGEISQSRVGMRAAPDCEVFVGNLSRKVSDEELKEHMSQAGEVVNVRGGKRAFGFVEYKTPTEAAAAIEKLDGTEVCGQTIRLGLATDK